MAFMARIWIAPTARVKHGNAGLTPPYGDAAPTQARDGGTSGCPFIPPLARWIEENGQSAAPAQSPA